MQGPNAGNVAKLPARKRVPEAKFRRASFVKAVLPVCEAVTSLGECFNYLFDRGNSRQALVRLFNRIHHALRPGGVLLFDLAEPGRASGSGAESRFWKGKDWAVLLRIEEHARRRELTRRMITFRKVGKLYRRDEEAHRLRLYKGSEIAGELRRAGFRVRIVRGYGRHRFSGAHVGFIARKPPA